MADDVVSPLLGQASLGIAKSSVGRGGVLSVLATGIVIIMVGAPALLIAVNLIPLWLIISLVLAVFIIWRKL